MMGIHYSMFVINCSSMHGTVTVCGRTACLYTVCEFYTRKSVVECQRVTFTTRCLAGLLNSDGAERNINVAYKL